MAQPTCPICNRSIGLAPAPNRPFCSKRCAEIDLGRWFTGQYRVPGPPPEFDEETSDPS